MNRSYYDFLWIVNTVMKFILVVYICLAGVCDSVYEQVPYDTAEACKEASEQVSITAQEMFPMSTGQVYCLTEDEFNKYQDYYDTSDEI